MKIFNNLKYCPNYRCGYDVDHAGYEGLYYPPWDVRRNKGHIMPGTSMVVQHKILTDGTGAGIRWLLTGLISQAQWVVAQRKEFGRLHQGRGGGG